MKYNPLFAAVITLSLACLSTSSPLPIAAPAPVPNPGPYSGTMSPGMRPKVKEPSTPGPSLEQDVGRGVRGIVRDNIKVDKMVYDAAKEVFGIMNPFK
jgi:hypothetical protein